MRKTDQIRALLKSIETGDPEPVAVVNEAKYIQHNPQTHEGSEGLAALFKRLSETSPKVNVVRAFEDGDFVFAHTEYDFASRNIGFELFRFEDGLAVEHWDNIQPRRGPNASGHSMVDGVIEPADLDRTEQNRKRARGFLQTVMVEKQHQQLVGYFNARRYVEHSPELTDDVSELQQALQSKREGSTQHRIDYQRLHRVLAEGDFVLGICEGELNGVHTSFFDLLRIADGNIVEHWGTTETIAPRDQWKNNNGKF